MRIAGETDKLDQLRSLTVRGEGLAVGPIDGEPACVGSVHLDFSAGRSKKAR
jgi:hypothetical protein